MYKDKAYNQELILSIIEHRERFNGLRGLDYGSLYAPNLNPIPPDVFIKAWESDYKTMQTNMIPEKSPSFKNVLITVKQATKMYNELKFE